MPEIPDVKLTPDTDKMVTTATFDKSGLRIKSRCPVLSDGKEVGVWEIELPDSPETCDGLEKLFQEAAKAMRMKKLALNIEAVLKPWTDALKKMSQATYGEADSGGPNPGVT